MNTQRRLLALCLILLLLVPAFALAQDANAMLDEIETLEAERDLPMALWSVGDKYEFDRKYNAEMYENPTVGIGLYALPGDGDIQEEEAREMALAVIAERYGEDAIQDADDWLVSTSFVEYQTDPKSRQWTFAFILPDINRPSTYAVIFEVSLDAETGDVLMVSEA